MRRTPTRLERSRVALRRDTALDATPKYAHESRSASTWRTYESAWRIFAHWCDSMALMALPAEPNTVAMFIGAPAELGLAESTLAHCLAAIRLMHLGQGPPSPHNPLTVTEVMRGPRRHRARAGREPEKKAPVIDATVKRLVDDLDVRTRRGVRDRALPLYGFAGALRRLELVGIDVGHIEAHERGHLLTIPFSKGDQEGMGRRFRFSRNRVPPAVPWPPFRRGSRSPESMRIRCSVDFTAAISPAGRASEIGR